MSEEIKKVILTITFSIIFLICWSFYPAYSQKMICGPSTEMIESVEKKFAERETERGIDEESAMLFVFTVGTNGSWSLLISPKSNPTALCMPLLDQTGYRVTISQWEKLTRVMWLRLILMGMAIGGCIILLKRQEI